MHEGDAKTNGPPGLLRDVARTEIYRGWASAEVGQAAADVRGNGDNKSGYEWRRTGSCTEGDEGSVHTGDMSAHTGKEIVAVEIDDEGEDQCCNHTDTNQLVLKDTGKPGMKPSLFR